MDELIAQGLATLRAMWRRRWLGLAIAWGAALLAALFLLRMPDRYEATARVYVDTKTLLKPLMRDLTVEPDIDQTLQLLARTLITRPNIEVLMRKGNLERPGMKTAEREALIERLSKEFKITSLGRDNVFTFAYRDVDAVKARQMVEHMVSLFVDSDLGAKQRDVDAARGFIDQQIKAYEVRLAEAENRVKDFKLRNLGVTTASGQDYFSRISALTDELNKLTLDLRAAEQSRDALKRELSGETVSLVPDVPEPAVLATPELDSRLDAQRKQLDELLRRYTDLHPDVVSTRRLIGQLEEQRQREIERKRVAEAARPKAGPSTNVAVQQTKLALAESEASVAALRVRTSDAQSRLAQLRSTASRVPQVEAELAQLNRDYEVVRRNYDALVTQREKAQMSEEVDATRLANFRIIDPPRTADKPVFPNRATVGPALLLLCFGVGAAACFLLVQLMPTVDNAASLRSITKRPVLGSVSMLVSMDDLRAARRGNLAFLAGSAGLFVAFGVWIAIISSMPVRS
ncbi:XrtA system polysaccharide chain length determinant [Variovorax sp. YR752]|uniref:XrtA system polysaccharide chain length determinant n=1 Tax=Variovorax sp. YR752 TaxID=1884383 RepID=UPI003137E7DA